MRLVLVGGGHAHVEVLRAFGRYPQTGVYITLISRQADTPYSGMLPGVIAGHYTRRDSHIALAPLAAVARATFVVDEADGLDLAGRLVHRRGGPSVAWDVLSLDIGSTPDTGMTRVAPEAVAVKPIDGFLSRWDSLRETLRSEEGSPTVAVIGAGTSSRRSKTRGRRSKPGGSTAISARPHRSLGHLTPNEFAAQRQVLRTAAEAASL